MTAVSTTPSNETGTGSAQSKSVQQKTGSNGTDLLARTQAELQLVLTRYQELYNHCEKLVDELDKERSALQAKYASRMNQLSRSLVTPIKTLTELTGVVQAFADRLREESREDDMAPKGARILIHQLETEIQTLKATQALLSSQKI